MTIGELRSFLEGKEDDVEVNFAVQIVVGAKKEEQVEEGEVVSEEVAPAAEEVVAE